MLRALSRVAEARVAPEPLALVRLCLGVAALAIAWQSRAHMYALADPIHVAAPTLPHLPALNGPLVEGLTGVWMLSAALLVVGWWARWAALGVAGAAIVAVGVDQQVLSNHLTLMIVLCLLLALGEPARAWSLHRSRHAPTVRYWPVFLLKTQLATVYAYTAIAKINPSWLSGEVLEGSVRGLGRIPAEVVPVVLVGVALATIGAELFLAIGLWFERTRRLAVAVGVMLHVSILVTIPMAGLWPFALITLSLYPLFWQDSVGSGMREAGGTRPPAFTCRGVATT